MIIILDSSVYIVSDQGAAGLTTGELHHPRKSQSHEICMPYASLIKKIDSFYEKNVDIYKNGGYRRLGPD